MKINKQNILKVTNNSAHNDNRLKDRMHLETPTSLKESILGYSFFIIHILINIKIAIYN